MAEEMDRSQVSVDGVEVEKRLNTDHPEHVAVIFDIRSERSEVAEVSIRDRVPERSPVGFHPDFGGQHWSIAGNQVEFERPIHPEETYRTVYGVGNVSGSNLDELTGEPVVDLSTQAGDAVSPEPNTDPESMDGGDLFEDFLEPDSDTPIVADDEADHEEFFTGELADEISETADQTPDLNQSSAGVNVFDADDEELDQPSVTDHAEGSENSVVISDPRIVIEKSLDRGKFTFPSIVFDITVTTEDPVRVLIEDQPPEGLKVDEIGFHHRYGDEFWEKGDDCVVLEREFEPGEEFTTLYAVRDFDVPDDEVQLPEPAVTVWHQPADPDEPGERIDSVRTESDAEMSAVQTDLNGAEAPSMEATDTDADQSVPMSDDDITLNGSEILNTAASQAPGSTSEDRFTGDDDLLERLFDEAPPDPEQADRSETDADEHIEKTSALDEVENTPSGSDAIDQRTTQGRSTNKPTSMGEGRRSRDEESTDRWISGTFKQKIEDLETTVTELVELTSDDGNLMSEFNQEFERIHEELEAVQSSIDVVREQSQAAMAAIDELKATVEDLEESDREERHSQPSDRAERSDSIADIAEEISLIKSTLASNMETSYQIQSQLEEIVAEIGKTNTGGAEADNLADDTLSSVQSLLEANARRLEELDTMEKSQQDAVDSIDNRLDTLADRMEGIQTNLADQWVDVDRLKAAITDELSLRNPSDLQDLTIAKRELLRESDILSPTLINGIGPARAATLESALGVEAMADLANEDPESVSSTIDVSLEEARRVIETARAVTALRAD